MSLLCCCIPRAQQKPPRLKAPSQKNEEVHELQTFRTLPTELWVKILKLLPLHVLWRQARPTCRSWNIIALDIVWTTLVEPTVIDVQWNTTEKRIRQRLYPVIPKNPAPVDSKPFAAIARWNLPPFEKVLHTAPRDRYICNNVVILLPSGKAWQNVASFGLSKATGRKDLWEFEHFTGRITFDPLTKEYFDPAWLAKWRVTFRESEERTSTSSRANMHLDHVTVPLAQFIKLIALAEEEEWPKLAKIDGFDRKRKSRPNSGVSTPRRGSAPNIGD
jgi:F-box-like